MSTTVKEDQTLARLLKHMQAVRDNWPSVVYMKDGLARDDPYTFLEAWEEMDRDTQIALWAAPKYGGVWTTAERKLMREFWNL